MFTMMNHARLSVGIQGLSISERAYQQALDYAKEREQGKIPGQPGRAKIIQHADVRRMLMLMKAGCEAMRAVSYVTATSLDYMNRCADGGSHSERFSLLTPVVKAWCTELAQEITSLGLQVHGGMGYIEETGAAQHYRDARITSIYEGTNGIQAQDLVGRKIIRDSGKAIGNSSAKSTRRSPNCPKPTSTRQSSRAPWAMPPENWRRQRSGCCRTTGMIPMHRVPLRSIFSC